MTINASNSMSTAIKLLVYSIFVDLSDRVKSASARQLRSPVEEENGEKESARMQ